MYAHKITIYQNGKNERSHLKAENEETHKRTYDLSQKKVVTLQRWDLKTVKKRVGNLTRRNKSGALEEFLKLREKRASCASDLT